MKEVYVIQGGIPLEGTVKISGAKNSVVALLPAALLCDEVCRIENVPDISDVKYSIRVLEELGAKVKKVEKGVYEIDPTHITSVSVSEENANNMRASTYYMGALLGKCHKAEVPLPGGCYLGERPIDQHIKVFHALGASCKQVDGVEYIEAESLNGAVINFDVVSVGSTINAILAAVKTNGKTELLNCAQEPHVVDLANFLNSMGAKILGAGTNRIKITGVPFLHKTTYSVVPDQIEAGTFMIAAAATNGDVVLENVVPQHLNSIIEKMRSMNVRIEIDEQKGSVHVLPSTKKLICQDVETKPHPGFPTDLQPQIVVLLCLSKGNCNVRETIWKNRFRYTEELKKMGAKINVSPDNKNATVYGVDGLNGADITACDLRAGAALMIAGLVANGQTTIDDIKHVERGYDDIVGKICSLNGNLKKIQVD